MEHRAPYDRHVTLDQLMALTPGSHRLELTRGQLVPEPPAGRRHGAIAMTIGAALHEYSRATNRGRVFTCDTGFVLARH